MYSLWKVEEVYIEEFDFYMVMSLYKLIWTKAPIADIMLCFYWKTDNLKKKNYTDNDNEVTEIAEEKKNDTDDDNEVTELFTGVGPASTLLGGE